MSNNSKDNNANIINSNNMNNIFGGKVIASGGFGCLFDPVLKCKNKPNNDSDAADTDKKTKLVSKLMTTKHAKAEYKEIIKYQHILKDIPNYSNYFLVNGFHLCSPDKLTDNDLINFNKKCSALKKKGYKSDNINSSLHKLQSLNMPYGGIDVDEYIEKNDMNYNKMIKLNNSLIELFTNGILPMNKKHIYHCDIKQSNVLVDETDNHFHTKLIDWGLSTTYNDERNIPKPLTRRPFQYNVPFSNVLFNTTFNKMYSDFLKESPNPGFLEIRTFVIKYVIAWVDERGPGHLKLLNSIFKKFFNKSFSTLENDYREDLIEFDYTFYFIFEYISKILFTFTKNNKFQKMEYFNDVFLKNIDVWGFIIIYVPIMEYLQDNYVTHTPAELKIIDTIKECVFMMIEASTYAIDTNKLISKLKELNGLFKSAERMSKSPKFFDMDFFKIKKNTSKKSKSTSKSKSKSKSLNKTQKNKRNDNMKGKSKFNSLLSDLSNSGSGSMST